MGKVSKRKHGKRDRWERRFIPRSTTNPAVVYAIGGLGAIALGAGVWGQFGSSFRKAAADLEPWAYAPWVLAGGAILLGIAIWIGTSGAAAVRVGSGGVAEERGQSRRIPWWRVDSIFWDDGAVVVQGKDDADAKLTIRFQTRSVPDGAAWLVSEAERRIEDKIDLPEELRESLGHPDKDAGELVAPPPLQLVGKRCSKSDKIIAYEPDARVCPQCERIYHKAAVPKTCSCGASLSDLREKAPL
jgi:hypothetical protein